MKKLLLLLITVSLFTVSCSKEEVAKQATTQSYTIQINGNEEFESITIQVKDKYANILETRTVTYQQYYTYSTNQGEQVDITVKDEDSFSGTYVITNTTTMNTFTNTFNGNRNLVIHKLLYQI